MESDSLKSSAQFALPSQRLSTTQQRYEEERQKKTLLMAGDGHSSRLVVNSNKGSSQFDPAAPDVRSTANRLNGTDAQGLPCACCLYDSDEDTTKIKTEELDDETAHFKDVCVAFTNYALDSMPEIARIEQHMRALSSDDKALMQRSIDEQVMSLKRAVIRNQAFLNILVPEQLSLKNADPTVRYETLEASSSNNEAAAYADSEPTRNDLPPADHIQEHQVLMPSAALPEETIGPSCLPQSGSVAGGEGSGVGDPFQPQNPCRGAPGKMLNRKHVSPLERAGWEEADVLDQCEASFQAPTCGDDCIDDVTESWKLVMQRLRSKSTEHTIPRNVAKVRSTIRQFVRDWSAEGAAERNAAYGPLLADLHQALPLDKHIREHGRPPRVLCPGSGLGRLPLEVVRLGYSCQGNEFSYFMLLGSNFILNTNLSENSISIQPYCLSTSNRHGALDHLRVITFPDVSASTYVRYSEIDNLEFSMCAGEFVEVYADQAKEWDGVLTCFFIDTAKNIFLYIRTIAAILAPGGLWSNVGPLLFHYADMPHEFSIELSWEEIKPVIAIYFTIECEEFVDCFYTTNNISLMQVLYHCIHFRAIRNDTVVTGTSNKVFN